MDRLILKYKRYILSVLWLLLMILFTYTPLVAAGLKVNEVFADAYCNNQCAWIAMLVNFGLLLMVVFDYWGTGKQPTWNLYISSIVGLAIAALICGHTGLYVQDELSDFKFPINDYRCAYVLHLIFFAILLYIKVKSMDEDVPIEDQIVQEEYSEL